jgi:hypothetical protein
MYDVNPLGPLMHLRELDRQAVPTLRPAQLGSQRESRLTALRTRLSSILSMVTTVAAPPEAPVRRNFGSARHGN